MTRASHEGAVLETLAHLDVLVERGALRFTLDGDVARYTI